MKSVRVVLALLAGACSAGGSKLGDAPVGAAGGTSDGGGEVGVGPGAGSGGASSAGTGGSCAASTEVAKPVEVNLFVSFDKSGSMDSDDKWNDATAAFKWFFQDPGTDGLRVAMRFFGDDLPGGEGCSQYVCNLAACAVPHVDVGPLLAASNDPQETALIDAIDARQPGGGGGTPLHPALHGATTWAKDYQSAHPSDSVAVILMTDGAPEGCNENTTDIANLAGDTFQDAGIPTYAIGLAGSHEGVMNQIAAAGGTGDAIFIDGGDVTAELLTALQQIQLEEATLPCQFAMPEGEGTNPNEVNVAFVGGDGSSTTIGQVQNVTHCETVENGWYYDDPNQPTTIILCADTCDLVQGDAAAQIEIVVGCATIAAIPE